MSVPNQKKVLIEPRISRDAKHLYATINIDALQKAIRELNGSALKIWLYLNKNQDRYELELSKQACLNWGIRKDSYYNGIAELERKGYLVQASPGSNLYSFFENPEIGNSDYFSENKNRSAEKQNLKSKKTYRNNTIYNTEIKQNKTENQFDYPWHDRTTFAGGESGGCGKAATDDLVPFEEMTEAQKIQRMREMGFWK